MCGYGKERNEPVNWGEKLTQLQTNLDKVISLIKTNGKLHAFEDILV